MNLIDLDKFQSISIDTRTLQKDDVFVALSGPNFDGHDFVKAAEKKGAKAAIVAKTILCNIPLIQVSDTMSALATLANNRRLQVKIPVIALTGSCGKTTTKTMLSSIFNVCGNTLATKENLNNNIGVALTLLGLNKQHEYAVVEIGANVVGEIEFSTMMALPDVALITNCAPVHLEGFQTLDNVACEKGKILLGLNAKGIAVLNADDKYYDYWCKQLDGKKHLSFGINNYADVMVKDIKIDKNGCPSFCLQIKNSNINIILSLVGEHNVPNALAAATCAFALGLPNAAIKEGLEKTKPVPQRMIRRHGYNGSIILDDTYNANPVSMRKALQVLAVNKGCKIFVVGDMGELGENAKQYHEQLGLVARECGIDYIYAVGKLTRHTVSAFGENAFYFQTQQELVDTLLSKLGDEVTVLVKGSKINHMWEIVERLVNGD